MSVKTINNLEKMVKLVVQNFQNPNNDNLIQILQLLKENEEPSIMPFLEIQPEITEEQILTQQLLDELQQSIK